MDKAEKRKLINDITTYTMYFLDIIDVLKRAENYKLRQHIKLSNQGLSKMINQGINSTAIVIRNAMIYEKFLEQKKLKKEAMEFMQEIMDEIVVMQEEGKKYKERLKK